MGLFDYFKGRKKEPAPAKRPSRTEAPSTAEGLPEADTMAILLLSRPIDWNTAVKAVEDRFGALALASMDNSNPNAPAMTVSLEGTAFFCSCMAMPHPPQACDLSEAQALASEAELEAMLSNQAFLVLAQQGGATSLEAKRKICRLFTQLAGTLLELDAAIGIYVNAAELLVSRRLYLQHAELLEQNLHDPEYFPVPVWVALRQGQKGEYPLMGTWGLRQFGFPELWFLKPSAPWEEISQRLYLLSLAEISGRDTYRDTDTIQFTPGVTSTFQALQGALFIVEEH